MDTVDGQRRKRVFVWMPMIGPELIDALSTVGIDVVALGHVEFPGIETFHFHDLFYGSPAIARLDPVAAPPEWLDDAWFRLYSRCIQRVGFVPLATRMESASGGIVPGYDLEDMARLHLSRAATVLKGMRIDEIWFGGPPHLGVDNMLSLAAQKLGIRVIEFIQVPSHLKFRVRVDDGRHQVRWDLIDREPWVHGVIPPNTWYTKKLERRPFLRSLLYGTWHAPRRLVADGWGSVVAMLHGWSGRFERRNMFTRMLERLDPRLSPWVKLRTELHRRFKQNRSAIQPVTDLDAIGDFVYFPLHLEPEMNVHILGRRFYNQADAIQAVHAVLPEGWSLLLKENPKQGYMHRSDAFYERLRMLPRVHFVPDHMPSAQLIDKCRLVATLVGTAGYEAVLAGKPCICLGDAWYMGLPGVFRFDGEVDLEAIAAFKPDRADLDRGMNSLLGSLPDGLVYPRYALLYDAAKLPAIYRSTARTMAAISAAVI